MRASLTDHLPDFFNAYFECFQFVDVIIQQKPDQQAEIFAYLCHAPVPPEVIIALADEVKKTKERPVPLLEETELSPSHNLNAPPTERKSPSLPDDQKEATLLKAVAYLQNLTPREKYQLFIKDSHNLFKITWARFGVQRKGYYPDPQIQNAEELKSTLRERNLHLIHGHTSGEVTGATNLDTNWGKGNDDKIGEYLASVHHTGSPPQSTEIEQTLFKYTANLSQHPSKEKKHKYNSDIDQKFLGIVPMEANDTLELGDMHANALRLIYHLIKHGVFEVDETVYGTMVTLYDEIFTLFSGNQTLDDKQKNEIIGKHNAFKTLIDNIKIKKQPIKLKLIGDLLADRGASDILMEWLIIKLHKAQNITLSILASNHDQAYFIEPGQKRNKNLPTGYGQRRSLDNAVKIRDKDPANEIKDYKFPEANHSINHSLEPVQLITPAKAPTEPTNDSLTPVQLIQLEKILRSPFIWALLSILAAAYPTYDCIQADNKLDSFSTVFDHLTHHGTLTLVLSAAAATCLLITAGVTLYSLCAKNDQNYEPLGQG